MGLTPQDAALTEGLWQFVREASSLRLVGEILPLTVSALSVFLPAYQLTQSTPAGQEPLYRGGPQPHTVFRPRTKVRRSVWRMSAAAPRS
ncbi:hypothetical protein DEDE109153_09325 [Deinococcus deserti]